MKCSSHLAVKGRFLLHRLLISKRGESMLGELSLKNFKAWENAHLEFGKITGLFGTNSSGKSSIIQFLLLLKQTKDATDRAISLELNGPFVSLGLFRDAIFRHQEDRVLEWKLTFERETQAPVHLYTPPHNLSVQGGKELTIHSAVSYRPKTQSVATKQIDYSYGPLTFTLAPKGDTGSFELTCEGGEFRFIRNTGRVWQLPGPIKSYAFPDQARTYFQNASFLADFEKSYEHQLDEIYYLGPLREYPQRDYLWARSRPTDVGVKGEKTVDAILAMMTSEEKRNIKPKARLRPFQEIVAYWLKEVGVISDFRVEEIKAGSNRWQALVRVHPESSEVLLTDVGFGVSQVLPVITLLQYVPEGATVILEQPEIHLHPLAQANLADIIINAAVHRRVQVILESHSEHLLLRLQRRIAEGDVIKSGDVKLYFCDWIGGKSEVKKLELDLLGGIQNWPDKFMGDAFGETAKAELVRIARRREKN